MATKKQKRLAGEARQAQIRKAEEDRQRKNLAKEHARREAIMKKREEADEAARKARAEQKIADFERDMELWRQEQQAEKRADDARKMALVAGRG